MRVYEKTLKERLRHIKERCNCTTRHNYYLYENIRVCDEWNDFDKFYIWAIENGFKLGLTIDRINGDKDYCPSNCRWVTTKEQNINRKSTIMIEYNGRNQPLSYWAKELGIGRTTIKSRMDAGLSFEEAIKHPLRSRLK